MDITLDPDLPVPTLRLAGRFDGDGATAFEVFVERLDPAAEYRILDFTGVGYLSSMGLRALVKAEKQLRARHGALVLASLSRPVRQVLEMARLHTVLRLAASVDEAMRVVRVGSVAPERAVRSMRGGRACAIWPLGGRSVLETWGGRPSTVTERLDADRLSTLTLDDLAFAVGTGGLGATREQASEATGRADRGAHVRGAADAGHAQPVRLRGARPAVGRARARGLGAGRRRLAGDRRSDLQRPAVRDCRSHRRRPRGGARGPGCAAPRDGDPRARDGSWTSRRQRSS